jgi:hypothetical protein
MYVLLLSALPCADNDTAAEHQQNSITAITNNEENQTPASHTEHCPPFCNCSCCHFSVSTTHYLSAGTLFTPATIEHTAVYHPSAYSRVYFDCWKPPRIG